MPGPSDISLGNLQLDMLLAVSLTPVSVAANTTAEQTFTVNGLIVGDFVLVQRATSQAGLGIVGARVSAANTLAVTYVNASAGPLVPTAEQYIINVNRRENIDASIPLPTAIV